MKYFLLFLSVFIFTTSFGQSTQTVRGVIKENFSEQKIEGVIVKLLVEDKVYKEAISNAAGEFEFLNVSLGTYDVLFSNINYKSFILPSVSVSVSKETVLNIEMERLPKQLKTVEVNPVKERGVPNNEMAVTSVFTIHPNDAKRIAGGLNDPIRVAGTLPGVTSASGFSVNFVSIRGNSPRGLKYYMDGIELPNPTHFARIGSSGGTFTIFNLDMLDKSDFYTGSFSAQYGDAIGGIFDVDLRAGNSNKHEFNFQVGSLGVEFGAEGPLSKKHKASYIFNYRYATVGLGRIGNPSQPTYQDFSFNINVPLKNNAKLQFFALSGMSDRTRRAIEDSTQWEESLDRTTLYLASKTATLGASYKNYINSKNILKISVIGAYTNQEDNQYYLMDDYTEVNQKINEYTALPVSVSASLKHKFGLRHKNITGFSFNSTQHNWLAEKYSFLDSTNRVLMNGAGESQLLKAFTQSKISITEKFSFLAGVHLLSYSVNQKISVEPRLSLNYQINERHGLSAAFGKHSQVENYATYLYQTTNNLNEIYTPNKNLDFVKAYQAVLSYKGKVFKNHSLRLEVYYQDLYDVPTDSGSFSVLNLKELSELRALNNSGTGQNYGIDIGFERYTDNGLYYIFNSSIYRSLYTGGDGVQRSTAFDNQYNLRFIVGKEYKLKETISKKNIQKFRSFSWNSNLSVLGGEPYTPVDLTLSKAEQTTVYDENLAFSRRGETLLFLDFNFSYSVNKKGRKTVWAIQVKNLFSNGQAIYREYDTVKDAEVVVKSNAFFPNIYYRLEF